VTIDTASRLTRMLASSRISETLETEILPSGVDRESLGFSAFGVTDRCFFAEFAGLKKSKLCKMTFP
jgi:hypothetical protein